MTTDSKTADFLDYMSKVRLYDLTQRLSVHTPPWPSYMPLSVQYFKRIAGAHMGQGANGQIIQTSNHVGTHMDGEIHFHACGRSIGNVPMEEWVGPGVVADLSGELDDYDLYSPEMLLRKADIHPGDHVVIRGASQNNVFVPKNVMVLSAEQWERMQQMVSGRGVPSGGAPANAPANNPPKQ